MLSILFLTLVAQATPSLQTLFIDKYPAAKDTQLNSCTTCHMPAKDGFLNGYGKALMDAKFDFDKIADQDSDGDGKKNADEIAAATSPGSQANTPELFVFTSKMAPVTFNHAKHVVDPKYKNVGNCTHCHTTNLESSFPKAFDDTVLVKNQAHAVCLTCHKESGVPTAPTKCTECHVK